MQCLGIETGFCDFCRYETETKPYPCYTDEDGETHTDNDGKLIKLYDMYLCEFCCNLSRNDMKNPVMRILNWGFNYTLKKLLSESPPGVKKL